jgi:hypothetical protein
MSDYTTIESCWVSVSASNGRAVVTLKLGDPGGSVARVHFGSVADASAMADLIADFPCQFDLDTATIVAAIKPSRPTGQTVTLLTPPPAPPARARGGRKKR